MIFAILTLSTGMYILLRHHVFLMPFIAAFLSKWVTAEMLPIDYTPSLLCSGVVDYDFYLPPGNTTDDLNTLAISMMSRSWDLLGAECKSDMKRLACARVYRPSVTGMSSPFKKPCRSLCDVTTELGTTCAGAMEGFGTAVNCSTDEFDASNDPSQCNAMESTEDVLLVAEATEPYIGATCQGVLGEILTPILTDPSYAPFQPPYVGQIITEFGAAGWAGYLPIMVESKCQVMFRRMVCGTMFPSPSPSEALADTFGTIYMPSFPHKTVCTEFMDTCDDFLKIVPALGMDCEARAGSIELFPSDTQVIAVIDNGPGMNSTLLLSEPDYMDDITFRLHTQCPYSTVVPDDPTGDVSWIEGFGCAMACPFRGAFTGAQVESLYALLIAIMWTYLLCTSVALYNIYFLTSPNKRNPFFTFMTWSMWAVAVLYVVNLTGRQEFELTCKDNAQYRIVEDIGESWNDFTCTVLAIGTMLYDNIVYGVFIAMTGELYCRVILEMKDVRFYRYFYVYGVAVMMVFLALFQLTYPDTGDVTIKGSFQFYCSWKSNRTQEQFYLMTLPFQIIYACCTIGMVRVVSTLVLVSSRVSGSLASIWKSYRLMFISVLLFVGVLWVLIFVTAPVYDFGNADKYTEAAVDWVTCLVVQFLTDKSTYLDVCGHTPELAYPVEMVTMLFVIYFLLCPIGVLWNSNTSEASKVWKRRFAPLKERFHFFLYPFYIASKILNKYTPNFTDTTGSGRTKDYSGITATSKVHPIEIESTNIQPDDQNDPSTGRSSEKYKPANDEEEGVA